MKRWVGVTLLAVAVPAFGQGYSGRGEGAIVIREGRKSGISRRATSSRSWSAAMPSPQ